METSTVNRAFQAALARASLPRQPFHHLRHAYATLMLEDGVGLIVVSRSVGHSTISTTADVYAHLTPATLQRSAERMDGGGRFTFGWMAGEEGFEPSIS